MEVGMFI